MLPETRAELERIHAMTAPYERINLYAPFVILGLQIVTLLAGTAFLAAVGWGLLLRLQ